MSYKEYIWTYMAHNERECDTQFPIVYYTEFEFC